MIEILEGWAAIAEAANRSVGWCRRWASEARRGRRRMPVGKLGKTPMIARSALEAWIARTLAESPCP